MMDIPQELKEEIEKISTNQHAQIIEDAQSISKKYRQNDGKIGITLEEKQKMDQITNLDKQIEEKQIILSNIESDIEETQKKSRIVQDQMKNIITVYEKKALELQMEMLKSIEELKNEILVQPDSVKEKGLK